MANLYWLFNIHHVKQKKKYPVQGPIKLRNFFSFIYGSAHQNYLSSGFKIQTNWYTVLHSSQQIEKWESWETRWSKF
jgi:hypothetical protein